MAYIKADPFWDELQSDPRYADFLILKQAKAECAKSRSSRKFHLADAETAYMAALRLADARLATDPANTEWQRDLSVIHNKIGDAV